MTRRRPVLVALRPLGLGDLLVSVPALRALAQAFPGHLRLLATSRGLAPLALLSGAVHAAVPIGALEPLPSWCRGPDVMVNLHGQGPQSHRVCLAARPRRLIAFAHPEVPETVGCPGHRGDEHEVRRWCRLLEEFGIRADPARLDLPAPWVAAPDFVRGATVIHPGAASPARRWPAERWAAVARAEAAAGNGVVVSGGEQEVDLARRVASMAGLAPSAVLAGRTSVLDLAAVVAAARRIVCGDTGVAHLATALGRPSVVLFGPVPPSAWGPHRSGAGTSRCGPGGAVTLWPAASTPDSWRSVSTRC